MFSYFPMVKNKFFCQRGHGRFGQRVNTPLSVSLSPENGWKFILETVHSGVFLKQKFIFYYSYVLLLSYLIYVLLCPVSAQFRTGSK